MSVSRRNFLKGLGLGAVGVGVASTLGLDAKPALAQSTISSANATAFARFVLGTMQITVLSDGIMPFEAGMYAGNAEPDVLDSLLNSNHMSHQINTGFNIMLIEDGDRKTLIDTGMGDFVMPGTDGGTGKLLPSLDFFGIAPDDITDVIVSHFHPDHIGGISLDGKITFANAQYHFSQPELDFLQSGVDIPEINGFIELANAKLQPLFDKDQINLYNADDEVVTGIHAMSTPGHTPGHMAMLLNSDGQQLLHIVDVAPNSVISLHNPDWIFGFDAVPDLASATRRQVLDMVSVDGLQVFGYHFPFPGLGYIASDGDGYRYLPTTI